MRSKALAVPVALALALALEACGNDKDHPDFDSLTGQFGAVPGDFNVRLAPFYRDKLDQLRKKVDKMMPGLSGHVFGRFAKGKGDRDAIDDKGTLLDDLLKISLPGADNDNLNRRIHKELSRLHGDGGGYFEVVDPEKYLHGPMTYDPDPTLDPRRGDQYYLDMIRWKEAVNGITDAELAAAVPVLVAVLDTGVQSTHEDLTGALWHSTDGETSGAVGFDAAQSKVLAPSESVDGNGHGTHVAGIIAATGANGKGIHGIAAIPGRGGDAAQILAEVMPIRILNDNGAGTSDVLGQGLKWAVNQYWMQKASVPARANEKMVVNMSLGGPFDASGYDYQKDANGNWIFNDDLIDYATSQNDVLVVVAAGNESCGIGGPCNVFGESYAEAWYYPCSYANVLCVAATTHEDLIAGFSNKRASVGLLAPGWQILSTVPTAAQYGYYSGTSQATPVVSGAASVVWALYPDFKAADIKDILVKSAAQVEGLAAQTLNGAGRLDLKAALDYAKELSAAKATPAAAAPSNGVVSAARIVPTLLPPVAGDPSAPSVNANAVKQDLGKGSGRGCGVVAGAAPPENAPDLGACALLAAGLMLPLARRRIPIKIR